MIFSFQPVFRLFGGELLRHELDRPPAAKRIEHAGRADALADSGPWPERTGRPGYLLQGIRGFPLKKRIKMKRTVSCRFYNTGKILTNPTPVVTKELNHIKTLSAAGGFLAIFATFFLHREKGRRSDPSALQKMEDRMKRCSCLASMSIDKRFYKSSCEMLQKL